LLLLVLLSIWLSQVVAVVAVRFHRVLATLVAVAQAVSAQAHSH
jgi:hypothetical protein